MAALRTADFVEMGRNHARNAAVPGGLIAPTPYPRSSTSWQARSYWSGYDDEAHRLANSAVLKKADHDRANDKLGAALTARLRDGLDHWPQAAAAHYRCLVGDINACKDEKRRTRLVKALSRMAIRYALPKPVQLVADFPISTQPHPDGPITLGMVLAGQ
jgi:hypothetical protein